MIIMFVPILTNDYLLDWLLGDSHSKWPTGAASLDQMLGGALPLMDLLPKEERKKTRLILTLSGAQAANLPCLHLLHLRLKQLGSLVAVMTSNPTQFTEIKFHALTRPSDRQGSNRMAVILELHFGILRRTLESIRLPLQLPLMDNSLN